MIICIMTRISKKAAAALAKFSTGVKRSVDAKQNKAIKDLKTKVAKLVQADEKKWYDTQVTSQAVSTGGAVNPMLDLNVWAGNNAARQNEREGNTLVVTSLKFDGLVYIDQTFASPDANNIVRIMLVQMTDDNITAPNLSDVLETVNIDSFYKLKGQRRYKVHYDKRFYLQNTTQNASPYDTPTEPFRKRFIIKAKIPKKGLKVAYAQGSISGNGPVQNGFFLLAVSDSGTISHPAIKYHSRMRFLDN